MKNVEYTDRDLRKDLTRTIRSFPAKEDSFPMVGRIFDKLRTNPKFADGTYRQEVKGIVDTASEFGYEAPDVLRMFEYAMSQDAKAVLKVNTRRVKDKSIDSVGVMVSKITDNLRSRIMHFKNVQGELPNLARIGKFVSQYMERYETNSRSDNHGKDAPGVAEKRGEIALQSMVESNDYEFPV